MATDALTHGAPTAIPRSAPDDIYHVNPYAAHPELSPSQSELLWELAKLNQRVVEITATTRELAHAPAEKTTKEELRAIDKKIALVLTLFKASVWGVVNEMADPADATYDADRTHGGADTTVRR